jgi:predicted acyl esterase
MFVALHLIPPALGLARAPHVTGARELAGGEPVTIAPGDSQSERVARRNPPVDTLRLAVAPEVELLTIVHRPPGEGPHPVVLLRNPYRTRGGPMGWLAERLVPHGYAVVEQDVRGTGGSGGTFVPFRYDVQDGTATLDWLAAQPWAGPVGLWGISYLGWAAYALAETGHPAIGAMAVGSAWAEMGPFLAPGGAFHLMAHLTWLRGFGGGGAMPSGAALDSLFRTLPLAPLLAHAGDALTLAERAYSWEAVGVPVLHFTGWHDYVYRDALRGYDALRMAQGPVSGQRLIVGSWAHNGELSGSTRVADIDFGPAAAAGRDSIADWTRRFFDAHLRALPEADAPVRIFVLGEDRWRDFTAWPPPGSTTEAWYLASAGRLESRPPRRAGVTHFNYDPEHPLPTLGGVNSHFFPQNLGPLDQSALDGRDDVVTFIGPALDQPRVLAGPIRAVLYLEVDAPSTDVAVKLIAMAPDGTARLVEDGIRRLPALSVGVNEVVVELGHRALRLEPGARLRVDVTGGNFPKYDRNPNTGEDPWKATALRPVKLTLHHGRGHPSRLEMVTLVE